MNITPHVNPSPIATAFNPQTENLRRENDHRQVVTPVTAPSGSAAEKGVADKDKGKTPAQSNEQFDFAELRKKAELNDASINGDAEQGSGRESEHSDQESEQASAEQNTEGTSASNEQATEHENEDEHDHKSDVEEFAESKEIKQLKQRDQEVRSHELAHAAVGGATTGSPSYEFEVGPDGKKYAVGGEVSVDLSSVEGNPRATIAKMQKVHAAALAPANPSVQDTRVAAKAAELINQAQAQLIALDQEATQLEQQASNNSPYVDSTEAFNGRRASEQQSQSFDAQINETLKAQETISPSTVNHRPSDVTERALRVEGYYSNITKAYEKPTTHQFQLTA